MKRNFFQILGATLVCLSLAVLFSACGNNNGLTPITPLLRGEMQATISGFGTFYTTNAVVIDNGTMFNIRASIPTVEDSKTDSVVITIFITKQGIPPYTVDFKSDPNSEMGYCILQPTGACNNYKVDQNQGSGSVKITNASSDNVQGTFSGTFQNVAGSGSVTISDGEFYATY